MAPELPTDTVLDVVLDAVLVGPPLDDVDVETVTLYMSNLFGPPQYSFLFPSQSMEQSVVAAKTLPALRVFPQ